MALTDEQKRRVYLYLGVVQASSSGASVGLLVTPLTHKLAAALDSLTEDGETTVVELLEGRVGPPATRGLDQLYANLSKTDTRFQASKVGPIELNAKEWDDRIRQWNWFLGRLDSTLFPEGDGVLNRGGGLQGPFGEP